jgi:hypothetical protein
MNAEQKLVRKRLGILELGKALGNVSEACRRRGVSRTQFYVYKRRFRVHGLQGLKNRAPVHKSHPFTTTPWLEDLILAVSLEHPEWGCVRLSDHLKREDISVSSPTIQRILGKHSMGSRQERMLKSEQNIRHGAGDCAETK